MRYRDLPSVEVVRRLRCTPRTAWDVEPGARWGFEVEATSDACLVRQFACMGPDESGISRFIAAHPSKEARTIAARLGEWTESMRANLERVAERVGFDATTGE